MDGGWWGWKGCREKGWSGFWGREEREENGERCAVNGAWGGAVAGRFCGAAYLPRGEGFLPRILPCRQCRPAPHPLPTAPFPPRVAAGCLASLGLRGRALTRAALALPPLAGRLRNLRMIRNLQMIRPSPARPSRER